LSFLLLLLQKELTTLRMLAFRTGERKTLTKQNNIGGRWLIIMNIFVTCKLQQGLLLKWFTTKS